MFKRPLVNVLRAALIVLGLLAAVNSVLTAGSSGNAGPRSPDYLWFLYEWVASFAVASLAFAAAIVLSRGWSMLVGVVLLLLTWSNGIGPVWQLLSYYGVGH
jgi:hypothetical protein